MKSTSAVMKFTLALLVLVSATPATHAADTKPYTRNVAVVVYEDAEPLDWIGPFEVWNDAASFGKANGEKAFNVYVVSKTTEPVNAQGLIVVPNYSIRNAPKPDIVVIPGGSSGNLSNDPEFFSWTKKAAEEAELAQTVCTGAFVLAKAGMLDGLEVTTWYGAISDLRKQFPEVTVKDGRRFVDNGHIVTTAGISAGVDGSLHLVARLLGRRVADQVARYMEYHWTPEAYLSTKYSYLNPSTDDVGRALQTAEMQRDEKNLEQAVSTYRSVLERNPRNVTAWSGLAVTLRELDDHAGAAKAYLSAADGSRGHEAGMAYYNAACEYALDHQRDRAIETLERAFSAGFGDWSAVDRDPDLASLRNDPRVRKMVAER